MNNLFYCPDIEKNNSLSLTESRHCLKTLRKKIGDTISITDGLGYFYQARIIADRGSVCEFDIEEKRYVEKTWNRYIHIAFAPTKNMDRSEWFIEKATEIGVDRITPICCQFSERRVIKRERLEKTAIAAMKQSLKSNLPIIDEMQSFDQFLSRTDLPKNKFIAHCYDSERENFPSICIDSEEILVLIGPEGDFSPEEIERSKGEKIIPIKFSESRLRTETAALYACNAIHVCEQMRNSLLH